ncbi:MAG TPA: FAD binding domain-containing protein [Terriglobales bacterium]|nr:FAD binding domain-containing protein [Terriglobales bacterium]
MSLPDFKLLRPRTLAEAVELLGKHADAQIVAGGTDLIPSLKQRLFTPACVIDIRRIAELRGIRAVPGQGIEIGALTTLTEIEHSDLIHRDYPVLHEAAKMVASPILRNMGTLGGNICLDTRCLWYNQSLTWRTSCGFCIKKDGDLCHVAPGGTKCWAVFSGDTPPALLCLDAQLEIAGPAGTRRLALRDFYTNVGDARMRLAKNELVTRVFLPERTAGYRGVYRKLRLRGSIDYPLAGVAIVLKRSNGHVEDVRVAVTAVNPAPLLVRGVEKALVGKPVSEEVATAVGELTARTAKPLTTSALTPEYRREMIRVFARRAVLEAARK